MTGRPEKHSLMLRGHRTSVSLEPEFWAEFQRLARTMGKSANQLAAEIDEARGTERGLASAIRVFVLSNALTNSRNPLTKAGDSFPD